MLVGRYNGKLMSELTFLLKMSRCGLNLNNVLHSAVHAACHSSQYCLVFEDHTAKTHDMDFTLG